MVFEEVVTFVTWVMTTISDGVKYVLNYVPQHFKYYMPGAILMLSLIFMALTAFLILIIQSGEGEVGIGTNSVSGGFGSDGAGRLGDTPGGDSGTGGSGSVQTTGAATTTLPELCGNGQCQNFQTTAKYAYEEAIIGNYCPDAELIYDIPDYCQNGNLLRRFIIYGASWQDPRTYPSANCMDDIYYVLNSRCSLVNHTLWYTENSQNCPQDCSNTYDCYYDFTCNDNPSNCGNYVGMECCSEGTAHEYECVDYGQCNQDDAAPPLSTLKHVPINCQCTSDAQCAADEGGTMCCTAGPHDGFCYTPGQCAET